jgi:hypothetical protein
MKWTVLYAYMFDDRGFAPKVQILIRSISRDETGLTSKTNEQGKYFIGNMKKELKVNPSLQMDVLKGWIRINKKVRTDEINRNDICSIKVKDKEIFREIRGMDDEKNVIMMDLDSRLLLDVKENECYLFEIKTLKWWRNPISYIKFYTNHPESGIKRSMYLGIISLILGLVSIRNDIYSLLLCLYHLIKNVLLFSL